MNSRFRDKFDFMERLQLCLLGNWTMNRKRYPLSLKMTWGVSSSTVSQSKSAGEWPGSSTLETIAIIFDSVLRLGNFTLTDRVMKFTLEAVQRGWVLLYFNYFYRLDFYTFKYLQVRVDHELVNFRLAGPPPGVKIGMAYRYDLCAGRITVFLDGNPYNLYLDEKPQLLGKSETFLVNPTHKCSIFKKF